MDFRYKEIPSLDLHRIKAKKTYTTKIDFKHKKYSEDVIDLQSLDVSGDNYYFKRLNPPYYKQIGGAIQKLLVRHTISKKLIKIRTKLIKYGVELYVFDCYRPLKVQKYLYAQWYPKYLKKMFPGYSKKEILIKRDEFAAKAYDSFSEIDKTAPPPHSTGGAIDLTLRFIDTKEQLFMGTIFDDISETVYTDYYEKLKQKRILSLSENEALKNRRLLFWTMKSEGFENYPNEWWHFSYGDQLWAVLSGRNEAFYSSIDM